MNYNHILKIIPEYESACFQSRVHKVKLPYHNMLRTQGVADLFLEQQDYDHQKHDAFYQMGVKKDANAFKFPNQ